MTKNRLGATAVVDDDGKVIGVITDGDLRRMLEKSNSLDAITAEKILTPNPKTIVKDQLAVDALQVLRTFDINQLIVTTQSGEYAGMIHIHDLLREGIV